MIKSTIHPLSKAEEAIRQRLLKFADISAVSTGLTKLFDKLKDSIYVVIEWPYVDKLHRDSYYYYYASKRGEYQKDTIRVAFFSSRIYRKDFREEEKIAELQKKYLGFLIIRPLSRCIGRNVISPNAFKERNFFIRTTTVYSAINGIKLSVTGFPHASQNAEALSCAETTVWSLMEYFGTRYSDYATILPSKIRELLKANTNERLLPSSGLFIKDISYLINKLGFGIRIYEKDFYKSEHEFKELLNCYVESGMPVVLGIMSEDIGHATLCIGRKYIEKEELSNIEPKKLENCKIFDMDSAPRDLVLIDDNVAPYQCASILEPTKYYENPRWRNCAIDFFIAPLHPRIYLEAAYAKSCLYSFLDSEFITLPKDHEIYIRFFLTSGRSFKHNSIRNELLVSDLKDYIAAIQFPKFIWVCELSTKDLIDEKKADGIIIFDATEADYKSFKPLIVAIYNNQLIEPDHSNLWNSKTISLALQPFKMYKDNLKLYK